jgi:hypothetical protein
MLNLKVMALATSFAVASVTGAAAQTFQNYGSVEGWNVFLDTEKKSCLIEKFDDSGNVVQMGLTEDRSVGYIGVFTKEETNIKRDSTEDVIVLLGENLYVGKATGMRGNITSGYSGGYILSDDPNFVNDVAQQYTMTVFPEKQYGFIVDLTGTKKAIEMARKCNAEQ